MRKNSLIKFLVFTAVFAFICIFAFAFSNLAVYAEETVTEANEEVVTSNGNSVIEWIKALNMNDVRAYVAVLFAKLGIDTMLIVSTVVYILRARIKEARQSKLYNDTLAKMSAEHQAQIEKMAAEYDSKLEALNQSIVATIKKQNAEKREEALASVDQAKQALSEIKMSLDE